jgi:phosphodiesterase/alkaline phosphatase D-like protein
MANIAPRIDHNSTKLSELHRERTETMGLLQVRTLEIAIESSQASWLIITGEVLASKAVQVTLS